MEGPSRRFLAEEQSMNLWYAKHAALTFSPLILACRRQFGCHAGHVKIEDGGDRFG